MCYPCFPKMTRNNSPSNYVKKWNSVQNKCINILWPTCPGRGKHTKLAAGKWYPVSLYRKNKLIYKWASNYLKRRYDHGSSEAFRRIQSQLEKQNPNFNQEY